MIVLVDKEVLYNSFGVNNFYNLEAAIDSIAPSLVEYELSQFHEYSEDIYFNKREVEDTISIGDYYLYKDYSNNIYLEINTKEDEDTLSFW